MGLVEKFQECNLDKSGKFPISDRIKVNKAISKELSRRGAVTSYEIFDALCEVLSDAKDIHPFTIKEKYLTLQNNPYLRIESDIRTITLQKAALDYHNRKRGVKKLDEIHIRGAESLTPKRYGNSLLFYKDKKRLYKYLSKRLKEKSLSIEYEFSEKPFKD